MAETLMHGPEMTDHNNREVIYLSSVAKYKLGKHIDSKRQLEELLKVSFICCLPVIFCMLNIYCAVTAPLYPRPR